ncbi:biogenesis of lysosome- organelles complex 1 subunit 1 [Chytriomyces hyalinus]|nr:biogenesis of lysosome- organelles complex 1 subunit 1 [Chytriomyces hyalinus]
MERILKEHTANSTHTARTTRERMKQETLASTTNLSDVLVEHANTPVSIAFRSQQQIETLERSLVAEAKAFASQSEKWIALVARLNSSLKELGHVENWVGVIEKDVGLIAAVLEEAPVASITTQSQPTAPARSSFWS